jgi:hypothetical protein
MLEFKHLYRLFDKEILFIILVKKSNSYEDYLKNKENILNKYIRY